MWVTDDVKEDDIFGVIIDMPKDESDWKKVLKNPAKFAAKSVSKGAEVAWSKLNPEQKRPWRRQSSWRYPNGYNRKFANVSKV